MAKNTRVAKSPTTADRSELGTRDSELSLRLLINAGPTREFFDSVRFISNPSTGKQGYAVAGVAAGRGHHVVLVSGPVALEPPENVELIRVVSAAEMAEACRGRFADCDAAILTAAVCDYRPPRRLPHKLQKKPEPFAVTLEPTEDIAAALGGVKGRRIVVGFAMNDVDARSQAERKLHDKGCDVMVLNGPENVGADQGTVQFLLRAGGWQDPITGSKPEIARHVLELVEALCSAGGCAGRGPMRHENF